jgi:hypothetical protein
VLQLVAEARREERGEAAPQPERRRILADQHGREIEPAEGEDGPGLGDTHAHRVPLAVEQRDLPQHLPRTGTCHLHRAIAGLLKPDREGTVDDEQHLSGSVPLAKEDLPVPHRAPAHLRHDAAVLDRNLRFIIRGLYDCRTRPLSVSHSRC